MRYAQDEKVVSSWNYAIAKRGSGFFKSTDEYNLTVTNKRIIYGKEVKNGYDRSEILLDSVKAVNIEQRSSNLLAYILIFLGVFCCVMGVILTVAHVFNGVATAIVFVAFGIVFIFLGIKSTGQKAEVKLYLTCELQPFAAVNKGAGTILKEVTKIKIRKEIFNDLRESLTALLIENNR